MRQHGDLLILRQNAAPPYDVEWDACLDWVRERAGQLERMKVLVMSDGGAPTASQRKRMKAVVQDQNLPIAVVSGSMRLRFIASSVALMAPGVESFQPSELHEAYAYLALTGEQREAAQRLLEEMASEVS